MDATPVLLARSGGKDAAWALHALRQRDDVSVVGLLTTVTREYARASMQGIAVEVLRAQAAAAGLPLLEAWIPAQCDNAAYDAAMAGALAEASARWPGLRTAAFGDLFLPTSAGTGSSSCMAAGAGTCSRRCSVPIPPYWRGRCRPPACARGCAASTRSSWMHASPAGPSTPRCWMRCRTGSIPAARTASSTPACPPGRCSPRHCSSCTRRDRAARQPLRLYRLQSRHRLGGRGRGLSGGHTRHGARAAPPHAPSPRRAMPRRGGRHARR